MSHILGFEKSLQKSILEHLFKTKLGCLESMLVEWQWFDEVGLKHKETFWKLVMCRAFL